MKIVLLKLPDHVLEQLDVECKKRRISKSALIRESLDNHLRSAKKPRGSALDLIRDLVGSARNALRDLSHKPEIHARLWRVKTVIIDTGPHSRNARSRLAPP